MFRWNLVSWLLVICLCAFAFGLAFPFDSGFVLLVVQVEYSLLAFVISLCALAFAFGLAFAFDS